MKIISEQLIRSLNISPIQCVEWIYESFQMKKEAQLPAKISVHPAEEDFFTSMPCLLPPSKSNSSKLRFFGIKEVHRIAGAIPSLGSDMLLYNAYNGDLLALMDCDWITTMRTGAVGAVSAKAVRKKNASIYGFIGLGNTARATLLCVLSSEPNMFFNVKLLKYKNQAEQFIERFNQYNNVKFEIVDNIEELVGTVNVLFSCITSAAGLLVENEKSFGNGITVIPIHTRGFQNCDTTFDRIFGDDTNHIKGFKYFSQFHDYNEISEVLDGRDPGRKSDQQRILCYNYGLALHDVVYASKIYEMIADRNLPEIPIIKEAEKYYI